MGNIGFFAGAVCLMMLFPSASIEAEDDTGTKDTRVEKVALNPKAISPKIVGVFQKTCAGCHDNDGKGEGMRETYPSIPDFTDPKWHMSKADEELHNSILHGKGEMKGQKKKLTTIGAQTIELVKVIRGFSGGELVIPEEAEAIADKTLAATGTSESKTSILGQDKANSPITISLYSRYCQQCHSQDGKGNDGRDNFASIPDFTNTEWHNKKNDSALASAILDGKGKGMPTFREKIPKENVKLLVTMVRNFGPGASLETTNPKDEHLAKFDELNRSLDQLTSQLNSVKQIKPR